jgi:hypothetical protein
VGGAVAAVVFFTVVVGRGTVVVVVSSTVVVVSSTVVVVSSSGTDSSPGATVVDPSQTSSYLSVRLLNTDRHPFLSYASGSLYSSSLQPTIAAAPRTPTTTSFKIVDPFFMSVASIQNKNF